MKTSYFFRMSTHPDAVSIAHFTPASFLGKEYKKLAPPLWLIHLWKQEKITKESYIKIYYREVLDKLNPAEVLNDLGLSAILLCYCKPGEFCHRKLVADWLNTTLNLGVEEMI